MLKFAYSALRGIYASFLRPAKNLRVEYGKWAVITGASDGIGEAYAHELARKGLNIVLVARSLEKLQKVQNDITRDHKVETRVITVDFSNPDFGFYQRTIEPVLSGLDIGILINNVGISYEHPMFFSELPQDRIDALVQLNVRTTTQMTRLVLPFMETRRRGAVINVGSVAGVVPSPLLAVYSGSKAYIEFFSRSLATEYRAKGIFVQTVAPSLVVSKLSKVRKSSLTIPSARSFVRSAVRTIGYDEQTSGYWVHSLQLWLLSSLPSSIIAHFIFRMHLRLRKRAQAKKAQ